VSERDAPEPDATEAYWEYIAAIGIDADNLRALEGRLNDEFRAADGGYAVLAALPMPQRAVVSDQILTSAHGVIRNLAEARLHEQDLNELLDEGVPYAERTFEAQERATRVDLSFVGFFRGIGSALDCAAATTIGVLRLPLSIRRASFGQLLNLDDAVAGRQPAWALITELIARHADDPPSWLRWTLEMRHALMHRPRQMSFYVPREPEIPPMWLPPAAVIPAVLARLRFDPHFRRKPWLPDMQHLADPFLGRLPDAVLGEKATQTVRGCFEATNRLVEDIAAFLIEKWADADVQAIEPPTERWALETPPAIEFEGFVPSRIPEREWEGRISPHDEERLRLAADLHNAGQAAEA
jgi:hypothetical protein